MTPKAHRLAVPTLAAVLSLAAASAALPQPADQPIALAVDATEAPRRILHARLTIPAAPGPLALVYPKWIPGEHGPTGPITNLVGLRFRAAGKELPWRRDPLDMYAFQLEVPAGASAVEADLDFLAPLGSGSFTAGASASDRLAVLSWNTVVLYPKGRPGDDVRVQPSLRLPAGWKARPRCRSSARPAARFATGRCR